MLLIMLVSWYANSLQWLFFYQKLSDLTTSYRKEILWLLWNWLLSILIGNWKTVEGLASNLETALHDASYSLHIYTSGPNGSKNIQVSCYFEEPNIVKSLSVFTCLSRCYWKNLACFFITYSGLCRRVIITRWLSFRVFFALSLNIIS